MVMRLRDVEEVLSGDVVALFPVGSLDSGELRTFFQRPRKPPLPEPWKHFSKVGICTHSHYKEENGTWSMVRCEESVVNTKELVNHGFLCLTHLADSTGHFKRTFPKVNWDLQTVKDIITSDATFMSNGKVEVVATTCKGNKLKLLS